MISSWPLTTPTSNYTPSATGITSLVWVLPVVAVAGIGAVLVVMLRPARASGEGPAVAAGRSSAGSAVPGRRRGRWRGVLVWTVGITVVAALAGVGVARFSGSRGAGESVTGDIRATTRQLIFDAQGALSGGDIDEAIALYDEALELQPSNVEALTYRGWLASRRGGDPDSEAAVGFIDDAIAIDPNYADARLFKAIISIENDDPARAAAELAAFDALDPPAFAETLIAQSGLRERIAEGLALAAGDSGVEPTAPSEAERSFLEVWQNPDRGSFAESGLNVADAVEASEAMAARGELLAAVQALDWVLVDLPDNPDVLAARGWLIARTGDPELVARAISYFDDALAINPQHPQALVYRAFSRSLPTTGAETGATDLRGAREDLATFDALPEQAKPQDLQDLITDYNLRATISPNN